MEEIHLKVQERTQKGKKFKPLLAQGFIPAVLYGHNQENTLIAVPQTAFTKVLAKAGESSFIDLHIGEQEPLKVLIQDYQQHRLTGKFTHVDFYKVNMDEPVHVNIELKFIHEAPAEKTLGCTLLLNIEELEAKCLPKDLVKSIDVDLSVLKTFEDSIHVKDVQIPEGIEILEDQDEMIAKVAAPRTDKEISDLDEKPAEATEAKVETKEGEDAAVAAKEGEEKSEKK